MTSPSSLSISSSPPSPSSPSTPAKIEPPPTSIAPLLRQYASSTARTINRLNTLLARTSTLDTTLLTTTYTLTLLHALLTRLPSSALSKTHRLPSNKLQTRLNRFITTLPPLTALLSDLRILLRLWGLLGIYSWAAKTYLSPPTNNPSSHNKLLKTITYLQILTSTIFQTAENWAVLIDKGVLSGKAGRKWIWSARAWAAYVALEFARLSVVGWDLRGHEEIEKRLEMEKEVEKEVEHQMQHMMWELTEEEMQDNEVWKERQEKVRKELRLRELDKRNGTAMSQTLQFQTAATKEKWKSWWRELGINTAYAPMTIHYSLEKGPLGEASLGALGVVVAWLSFGKAWRECA